MIEYQLLCVSVLATRGSWPLAVGGSQSKRQPFGWAASGYWASKKLECLGCILCSHYNSPSRVS